MSFYSVDEKEILFYKLEATSKPLTQFTLLDNTIDAKELLMLTVLGCYMFKGIAKENDASDFIVMVAAAG